MSKSNFMEKPIQIYNEHDDVTTSTTSTTKKMSWEKPVGWDGKKPPKPKAYKPSKWQILKAGLTGDESLEPKYIVKYDNWMHELKIICITILVNFTLIYCVFNSPIISTSAASGNENDDMGYLNRGIDYLVEKYDEWQGNTAPIVPDTIYQVHRDTISLTENDKLMKQVDSIMAKYKQDSLALADSLKIR